jgi:valine--pyruvate aminotransferase
MDRTRFRRRFGGGSGIGELMDDLGRAMAGGDMLMLGGGNPASIPEINNLWTDRLAGLVNDRDELTRTLVYYDTPQGHHRFLEILARFLSREYGFDVGPENIAVTNGSQSAFFHLFNLLGGTCGDGIKRKILFPLVPEYIGYADQPVEPGTFRSLKPKIEELPGNRFKYHIDFSALERVSDPLGAVCVSRPTNPTGNVLTDTEIRHLRDFCRGRDIPLIIDNAYGAPFPDILFRDAELVWDDNIILTMSLSKLGLPNTRTGIVVARADLIRELSSVNAILSLSSGTIGQVIAGPLIDNGTILRASRDIVRPYYEQRSLQAQGLIDEALQGLPYRLHVSEGAIFLWLWLKDLPIPTFELYQRLKGRKVLVIPGKYFFYGLAEDEDPSAALWRHREECIRLTYSQDENTVREGIRLIGEELRGLY